MFYTMVYNFGEVADEVGESTCLPPTWPGSFSSPEPLGPLNRRSPTVKRAKRLWGREWALVLSLRRLRGPSGSGDENGPGFVVGSLPCSESFFSENSGFPLSPKINTC